MDVRHRCPPPLSMLVVLLSFLSLPALHATAPAPAAMAAQVDAALVRGLPSGTRLPALIDDAAFLRRVSLDLTGKLPDPEALRAFVADTAAGKRARVVEELLQSEAFAVNWGRYWRDTVSYHTPASGNYLR